MLLVDKGYAVDMHRGSLTNFDGSLYSMLLLVDPEQAFSRAERTKLRKDVESFGLSLLVIADWFDEFQLFEASFMDDNTRSKWHAVTAGSNVPAINALLSPWKIQLGKQAILGRFFVDKFEVFFLYLCLHLSF